MRNSRHPRQHCSTLAITFTAVALLGAVGAARAADAPQEKPNILLIVADDLGWADVGWHGAKFHKTPVMDRLVKEGVELDRHYVQPVCTPTRTALMSGRYPSRFGPHPMTPSNLRALPSGTETIASALKSVGYFTAMAGKWHLGARQEWGPKNYGFERSYGTLTGAADPWTHGYRQGPYAQTWHRDGVLFTEEGNTTELIAAEAEKYIREKRQPWFVYTAFHAVHIPIDTPEEYKKLYADVKFHDDAATDDGMRRYAAFCSQLDTKVGQLVKAVEETGQRQRTLIIFTSDNGGLLSGGNAYISKVKGTPILGSNVPLRGQKNTLYEGGTRVSAFANWPGTLAPSKCTQVMHAVDWFPTLAALGGYAPKSDLKWDGKNVWPQLSGKSPDEPRTIYIALPNKAALRDGDWKLIQSKAAKAEKGIKEELFNLAKDPNETTDLAAQDPDRVKALREKLELMRQSDRSTLPEDLKGLPQ